MRELVYYVAVSIDGFIADPRGGFDPFLVEGDHSAVVFGEFADALPGHAHTALGIVPPGTLFDTVVMGWNTLTPALEVGISSPYPHLHQVVASRHDREHDPAITLTDDPLSTVRALKRGEVWTFGSAVGDSLRVRSSLRSTDSSSSGILSSSATEFPCSGTHRPIRDGSNSANPVLSAQA